MTFNDRLSGRENELRALEDFQCVSVKQGPFLGDANDKINIEVRE